jgi:hypothetical protein
MKKIIFLFFLFFAKFHFSQLPVTCSLNILNTGNTGNTYSFSAIVFPFSSSLTVYTWSWNNGSQSGSTTNIGNGFSSFNFPGPGIYTVCVNTFSSGCSNNPSGCTTVNVSAPATCSTNMSVNNLNGNNVTLSASVIPTPTAPFGNYVWTWNGPSSGSLSTPMPNAILTLTPSGLYTVCVTAFSTGCSNNPSTCTTVNVSSMTNCTANLNVNVSGNNANATVNITPGNPTSGNFTWNWIGVATGSATSTTNTLNLSNLAAGVYDLCVTGVSVSGCSNLINACQNFTIGNLICQPTLNVISSSGNNFQFSVNVPGGGINNFNWIWSGPANGNTITSTPTVAISFTPPGVYQVCAIPNGTNSSCMTFTAACLNITVTATGISYDLQTIANVLMYPNPVENALFVKIPLLKKFSCNVFDINGKLILERKNENSEIFEIDLSPLKNGIYFMQIHTDQAIINTKFIKK